MTNKVDFRLENNTKDPFYFYLCNFSCIDDEVILTTEDKYDFFGIRKFVLPENKLEVLSRIENKKAFHVIASNSNIITHEAYVRFPGTVGESLSFMFTWLTLIKLKSKCVFWCPFATRPSLSKITSEQINDFKCIQLDLGNFYFFKPGNATMLSESDFGWIYEHLIQTAPLLKEDSGLRVAFEAISTFSLQSHPTSSLLLLWSGLESLFDVHTEITYRVALYIAFLLGRDGDSRHAIFISMKKRYDLRSRLVHGKSYPITKIRQETYDLFCILCDILITIVERGKGYTQDELDKLVFSVK
jgi:hypothetical protein